MSLTMGRGPLSAKPADSNYEIRGPEHRLFIEDSQKRVRVEFGSEYVVDTRQAKLLHETGLLPVYYFPRNDIRFDLLEPSDHSTTCPFKGRASYFTVRVGNMRVSNAAWAYPDPRQEVRLLAGYVAFYLDKADAVYEEDEKLIGHPHDPYHRVDTLCSKRHVRVSINGDPLADTRHARAVFETGLPVRWYIPRTDIHLDRLEPSTKKTICPYKGVATYWSLRGAPGEVAWAYDDPLPEATGLSGHLSFEGDGIVVEVD